MPCYDPPYDDQANLSVGLQAREKVAKYVQQLKDIETYCKNMLATDAHGPLHPEAVVIAEQVIEMVHAPWRS